MVVKNKMRLALQYENQISSKSVNKINILTVIIIALVLLFIFLFNPAGNQFSNTTSNINFPTANIANITPSNNGFTIWLIIITILLAFLVPLGAFVENKPKVISEIITSQNFELSFRVDADGQEYALIDLQHATLQIHWLDYSGQPQNWKISILLNIYDKVEDYTQLAKLLFMELDHTNKYIYQKQILAKDWPRQDYLLNYWLKGLII